jgi:hypothetical protein
MRKRSSRAPRPDENQAAMDAVAALTDSGSGKNPAAVALGRLGGRKGGPARAKALSRARRSEIAKEAAQARWRKSK